MNDDYNFPEAWKQARAERVAQVCAQHDFLPPWNPTEHDKEFFRAFGCSGVVLYRPRSIGTAFGPS